MKYMTRESTTPYIMERSVIGDESELVLTPTEDPTPEIEDILDAFAREYVEDV